MYGTFLIRRIGVGAAFKIGAVLGGVMSAVVLFPMGLLMALGVISSDDSAAIAGGAVMGLATVVCGPLVYAFIYGLMSAFSAFIYNIIAGLTGGPEIYLERPELSNPSLRVTAEHILGKDV